MPSDAARLPGPGALHPARRDRVAESEHLIEDVAKAALSVVAEGNLLGGQATAANQFLGSVAMGEFPSAQHGAYRQIRRAANADLGERGLEWLLRAEVQVVGGLAGVDADPSVAARVPSARSSFDSLKPCNE